MVACSKGCAACAVRELIDRTVHTADATPLPVPHTACSYQQMALDSRLKWSKIEQLVGRSKSEVQIQNSEAVGQVNTQ